MTRDELIIAHQKDAKRAAGLFWRRGGMALPADELEAEALLCLVKAASDWNEGRATTAPNPNYPTRGPGEGFAPFLVQRVKWALIRWVELRTGGAQQARLVKAGKANRIKEVGLTITGAGKYQDEERERELPDSRPTPEAALMESAESRAVLRWLDSQKKTRKLLTKGEASVLRLAISGLTLGRVAEQMGLSRQRIDQLLKPAILKARHAFGNPEKRKRRSPRPRTTGRYYRSDCEWCGEDFEYRSPVLATGKPRWPRRFCTRPCISASIQDGRRKLPMNEKRLRDLYEVRRLTTTEIAKMFRCKTHKSVCRALQKFGIQMRPRHHVSNGLCKQCGAPAVKRPDGRALGRLCRVHQTEYQTKWARRVRAKDPEVGFRRLGRKLQMRPCPKCGATVQGARAAFAHCPKDQRRQERSRRGWITRAANQRMAA